jgi:ABC-type transport system substrate-binding protein
VNQSRWYKTVAILMLVGALVGACSTKTDSSTNNGASNTSGNAGTPKAGGSLTVGLDAETDGWNPSNSQWAAAGYYVAQSIFDPLMTFGSDNKPHPYLAQSLTSNPNFTQWTMTLRPGIKFQDGEPLNAAAVALQLTKNKASVLVGQAYGPFKSATAVNDLTVRIDMSSPWSAFPAALTTQGGYMAAPKQLNATGKAATDDPIGTGPYSFKQWVRDDHLTVVKNPNYWRKGLPLLDQITYKVIIDPQSRLNSLQAGQLDYEYDNTAANIVQAENNKKLTVIQQNLDQPTMVMLNTAVAPLNDVHVRQALAYATNVQQLINTVGQGMPKQADGPYQPGSPWYAPSGYPLTPNLDKAKSLINAYKTEHHISGDLKFTLACTPTTSNNQSMELIKSQWAKVGIDVTRKTEEQATYINDALLGKFQANCWTYLGTRDPDIDAIWMFSTNANPPGQLALNFPRIKDPAIDQAYLAARTTDDHSKRAAEYAKVWKRLAVDLPYIWTTHLHNALIFRNNVQGVQDFTLPDGSKPPDLKSSTTVAPLLNVWLS